MFRYRCGGPWDKRGRGACRGRKALVVGGTCIVGPWGEESSVVVAFAWVVEDDGEEGSLEDVEKVRYFVGVDVVCCDSIRF